MKRLPAVEDGQDTDWAAVQEARRIAESRTERERRLMQKRGEKIYLGDEGPEKHDGWNGSLPFYLFWCEDCEHWCKDYPHGNIEYQYLLCEYCGARHDFVPWQIELKMAWESLRFSFLAILRRWGIKKLKPLR